jgi:hypothetical protein
MPPTHAARAGVARKRSTASPPFPAREDATGLSPDSGTSGCRNGDPARPPPTPTRAGPPRCSTARPDRAASRPR